MSSKTTLMTFGLVFGIATTAWAQNVAPADAAPAAEAPATAEKAPAAAAAPAASAGVSSSSAEPGKFFLGLRLGYGLPMGDVSKNSKMSEGISGVIPIGLDIGYMVTKNVMVGAYGQYGILSPKNCDAGADCSGSSMHFGIEGQFHIMPTERINPWLGLGIGYEILSLKETGAVEGESSIKGMEYLNLQGGADFKLTPGIGIGPFLNFSMGQYGSMTVKTPGVAEVSRDIPETAMHEWLTFGVRGAFNL